MGSSPIRITNKTSFSTTSLMNIKLYIARHGQTEENVRRVLQGQMPGHLTEEGISQAKALREKLKDTHFDYFFTSDLKRAVDSTQIICEPHGDTEIQLEPLLRERDFGIHTGGPYLKISHALDPSAETMEQVAQRAADFLNTTLALEQESVNGTSVPSDHSLNVLAVSHGLFLRVLQAVFYSVEVREIEKMENAEVRVLELKPGMHFTVAAQEEAGGTAN